MHFSMDFMTFLAVCAVVVGAGSFGIAALRSRRNGRALFRNESGQVEVISVSKVYSIVKEKIQEFYGGTCKSERSAIREVLRAEMKGIKKIFEVEIRQVNDTLIKGLENIQTEIKNGNSDTGSKPDKEI